MSSSGSFFIETWGCQMNELDSARLAGRLVSEGWTRASSQDEADLVLLNTCSVREKAEEKVFSSLGRIARIKRSRPDLLVGVAGCVAQQEGGAIFERADVVDFVLGTGNVDRIGEIVAQVGRGRPAQAWTDFDLENPGFRFDTIVRENPTKAMVTVVEGCDKFCTFCVVPFTRGRERSRRRSEIVEEVRRLVGESGTVEVLLLGQTVNAYVDPETGEGFGPLLREVAAVPGLRRLRFVTSHPVNVDDGMISAMAENPVVCRYLHLPPQSGSDRILSRMKRQYTSRDYVETASRLRAALPGLNLSGDIIVGFPGETEADFEATLALVREVRFGSLFTFKYSERPGTAAARWPDHLSEEEKAERLARLSELQEEIQLQGNRELLGRTVEVLVDGEAKKAGQFMGRTDCHRIVNFSSETPRAAGSFVQVRIEVARHHSLSGSVA